MSGIIAVYSLVISVLIAQDLNPPAHGGSNYSLFKFVTHIETWPILNTLTSDLVDLCILHADSPLA